MASILKVDKIQLPDGSAPTASDLGVDVSGSVVQVKEQIIDSGFQTTSSSFVATGVSISITPKYANSKIIFMADPQISIYPASSSIYVTVYRDGVNLGGTYNGELYSSSGGDLWAKQPFLFVDAPNTTSQVTYQFYIRRNGGEADLIGSSGNVSYMVLQEIAQ